MMSSHLFILNFLILPFTSFAFNTTKRAYIAEKNLCPEIKSQCECTLDSEGRMVAVCKNDLAKFPAPLPPDLRDLTIYCRGTTDSQSRPLIDPKWFSTIPASALKLVPRLELLSIMRCPVFTLPPFLFANLTNLRKISFESLLLKSLDKNLLKESYSLQILHLAKMVDLKTADPELLVNQSDLKEIMLKQTSLDGLTVQKLLAPIKKSLRDLIWTSSVVPVTIPPRTFYGFRLQSLNFIRNELTSADFLVFTKVRILKLTGNPLLATTPPFDFSRCRQLKGLVELDMGFSNLRMIPNNSLLHMKKLRKLFLGNNNLETVPYDIYKTHLKNEITDLDLSNNQIQVFPEEMSTLLANPRLTILINGNRLHCNCEAKWLQKYMNKLEGLKCDSGPLSDTKFKNQLLTSIPTSELVCTKPTKPIINANNMIQRRSEWSSGMSGYRAITSASSGATEENLISYEDGRETITISRGQKISLRCVSKGDPAPQLYWIFPWDATLKREPAKDRTIFSNEISVKIAQEQLKHYSVANFTCVAENILGRPSQSVFLKNLHPVSSTVNPIVSGTNDKVTPMSSKEENGVSYTIPSVTLILFSWIFLMVHNAFNFSRCFLIL